MNTEKLIDILSLSDVDYALEELRTEIRNYTHLVSMFNHDIDEEILKCIENDIREPLELFRGKVQNENLRICEELLEI